MKNFYQHPKIKKYVKETPNPTWDNTHIDLNSRVLVVGQSGTGKTNGTLNYIAKSPGLFQRVLVCSRGQPEPIYQYIQEELGKSNAVDFFTLDTLPDPMQIYNAMENPQEDQYLIIFDDLIADMKKPKVAKKMDNFFIMGRKCHLTMWFLSQSYYEIPKLVRQQMTHIVLLPVNSDLDFDRIAREFTHLGVTVDQLKAMHKICTSRELDWLKLDLKTRNPQLRFARNFTDAFHVEEYEDEKGKDACTITPGPWFARKRKRDDNA